MVYTVKRALMLILIIAPQRAGVRGRRPRGGHAPREGIVRRRCIHRESAVDCARRRPQDAVARAQPAPADLVTPAPYAIVSAALTQQGQQIIWQIELAHSFTAAQLARDGRSLCLSLEHLRTRAPVGELCVKARRGRIALAFTPAGSLPGAAHAIEATISRSSPGEMTATFLPPRSVSIQRGALGGAERTRRPLLRARRRGPPPRARRC